MPSGPSNLRSRPTAFPGAVSANSLSIPVTATAGQLSQAFSTSFARVALASGKTAIVNTAPTVDPGVAGVVQGVIGLSTLSAANPLLAHSHRAATRPPRTSSDRGAAAVRGGKLGGASKGAYTTDQIASAYGFSGLYQSGDVGAGQTIAIVELEPYDPGDIAAFDQCYGTSTVSNVSIDGGAGSGAGAGEAALDIENVIGLAPRAKILVYEGPNSGHGPMTPESAIISQRGARVVTASWGQCEALEGFSQRLRRTPCSRRQPPRGRRLCSASGDEGSEDCYPTPQTLAVDDPASQPFVTGVGGTTLSATRDRRPPGRDRVEQRAVVGAGGGGISTSGMPSYQRTRRGRCTWSTATPRANRARAVRRLPRSARRVRGRRSEQRLRDLLEREQPVVPPATAGWQVVGGTSAAAPAWAALIALTNASAACAGAPIGFANPALYHAGGVAYSSDFNDITSGNNDLTGTCGLFPAGSGYDMASGLGSPNGTALARRCAPTRSPSPTPGRSARRSRPASASRSGPPTRAARPSPTKRPDCRAAWRSSARPARSPAAPTGSGNPP